MKQSGQLMMLRTFTSLIFIYAGIKHLVHPEKIFKRIEESSLYEWMPFPQLFTTMVLLSGIVMIGASLLLVSGRFQKLSASLLLLVLAGITLTIQLEDLNDLGPFFKNVAIAGSLIFLLKKPSYAFQKISLLFVSLFMVAGVFAQKRHTTSDNLLFLLRQPEHITQALKTVQQLQEHASKTIHPKDVVIIVCGEAVKAYTGQEDNEQVNMAKQLGVKLVACGLSLKKFNLTPADLMPGMGHVENGLITAFELQKAGYLSVEL